MFACWYGSQIEQEYSKDGKTNCLYACSFNEMDSGEGFYVKIPVKDLQSELT